MTLVADKLKATGKKLFNGWQDPASSIPKAWVKQENAPKTPIVASPNDKSEPQIAQGGQSIQPRQSNAQEKAEQINENINPNALEGRDVRNELFTRNRLAGAKNWADIAKQINEGLIGNEELDYLKSNDPDLHADTIAEVKRIRDVNKVNQTTPTALVNDEGVAEYVNIFQTINDNAVQRMSALAESRLSTEEIYNKYLDTPELNEKAEKYNAIQSEIIELNNIMKQTEDDIRAQKWWNASESYIRALASNQNKALQRQVDALEDDAYFAQTDYNTALSSAERLFWFEVQEQQFEYETQNAIIQQELWMDLQAFWLAWDLMLKDKENEEKEYWYNRDLEDKKALMSASEEQQQASMLWMRENWFDNSNLIQVSDWDNLHIYDTNTNEIVRTFNWTGSSNSNNNNNSNSNGNDNSSPSDTNYTTTNWDDYFKALWWEDWYWSAQTKKYWWVDFALAKWTNIPSPITWEVVNVVTWQGKANSPSYGNYVDVKDSNGNIHRFAHLDWANVSIWDSVNAWDSLWKVGNSWYTLTDWWTRVPTDEEWKNGRWSHLDYSIKKADWSFMAWTDVKWYLNQLSSWEPVKDLEYLEKNIFGKLTPWSKWEKEKREEDLWFYIDNKDKDWLKDFISNSVASSLTWDPKNAFLESKNLNKRFWQLRELIIDFRDAWGETWLLTGKREDFDNYLGETNNPELVTLGTTLTDQLDIIIRERTWAAISSEEEAFYNKILPNKGKSFDLNMSNIEWMIDSSEITIRWQIEAQMWSWVYEEVWLWDPFRSNNKKTVYDVGIESYETWYTSNTDWSLWYISPVAFETPEKIEQYNFAPFSNPQV